MPNKNAPAPTQALKVQSPAAFDNALTALVAAAEFASRGFGHRGYWRFCSVLARLAANSHRELTVREADFAFRFPLNDPYWLRLLGRGFAYEPELAVVLKALGRQRYLFLDCGANLGYWSARVSSAAYGGQPAIAIEADANNYRRLAANAELNANRFAVLHRALWETSGVRMDLFGHADFPTDFSLAANQAGKPVRGTVETICLDDLALTQAEGALPVVIKLDVEGVEAEALRGAKRVLAGDCLVLYEDHGADRDHASTRWFLEQGGYQIWAMGADGLTRVIDLSHVERLKSNLAKGYNFAATHVTGNWRERLNAVDRGAPSRA